MIFLLLSIIPRGRFSSPGGLLFTRVRVERIRAGRILVERKPVEAIHFERLRVERIRFEGDSFSSRRESLNRYDI